MFYLLIKLEENLRWWFDWLRQLRENDPEHIQILIAFCFNIHQHGHQILYFNLHVYGCNFHYWRPLAAIQPQVVHRCT